MASRVQRAVSDKQPILLLEHDIIMMIIEKVLLVPGPTKRCNHLKLEKNRIQENLKYILMYLF